MVRAILLGAGPAGERHGRAFRALADRCLVAGVYDPDPEAAKRLAMTLGVPWLEALEPSFQEAHVAIVAGVVDTRPRMARAALEAGLDVLIEPPLAPTVELAHGLLSAIVRAPRRPVAQVAFDEHFDPTVRELRALVADQTLVAVHVDRMDPGVGGPLADLDVVSDLMVHDLQFVMALTGEPIAATQAAGRRVRRGGPVDHAQALLVMEDDLVASLVASRAGGAKVRHLWVTTTQAEIRADLETRVIEAVRTTATTGRHESIAQRIALPHEDPAVVQAATFLKYVERRTAPEVGIGQAIACQEAALAILKRIELIAHRPAMRRGPQAA
ncbi:Inositol 2-dehydrogenase/D-chiro-inositol 3-dehydrogenase [Baekduia alba]|uniref:Gfo/Idh/MocA family protein n=1 Tax=Baekduia alba TaxID=2997333 RepID=UPI002340D42E|nr:Gfo/Idh/MocA family oxidoreductase [Baekduia alba]WCB91414.1 Inositol 2-dehydrogenase/D-chiro-inositol 3-dehydrogenase [Baekduia alba]